MLQFGLSPEYVLDNIEMYEINSLMAHSYYRYKESWEQSRLISFLIAQTHSTKKLKLEDIIKFEWEKDTTPDAQKITKEDIERLTKEAEALEAIFVNQQ